MAGIEMVTHGDDFVPLLRHLLRDAGWEVSGTTADPWSSATPPGCPTWPAQGWKLHLTASESTAAMVLARAVPLLTATGVPFKVAATQRHLAILNMGEAGFSQVGKFITVYPPDDSTAVSLARELDVALLDLTGPAVPSDRPLRVGGAVWYRYGGFTGRWIQTIFGELSPAIEAPDGTLVRDTRTARDAVPAWLDDPFEAAGLVQPPEPTPTLVAGRFRVVTTIHRSARGSVHLAIDLRDLRRCVLKRALVDKSVSGATARLRHEHEMLSLLGGIDGLVGVIDWSEDTDECVLALEDISGRTLMSASNASAETGFRMAADDLLRVGLRLAEIVGAMHDAGVVHRDIKPTNVLVEPDGTARLIDLELACCLGHPDPVGWGTIGYVSPEQQRQEPPQPADDVYSLGATLFVLATGAEMGTRPLRGPLAHRARDLAPDLSPGLAAILERCLAPTRAERFANAGELHTALQALTMPARVASPAYGALGIVPDDAQRVAAERATRLADALVADSVTTPRGAVWISRHPSLPGVPTRDLNTGVAGGLLTLTALTEAFPAQHRLDTVAAASTWLDAAGRPEGEVLGGLYVGEAGVAAALLRAGQLLDDRRLLTSARQRSRFIAALPLRSHDLFNGAAGRLRLHLWVAEALGDDEALAAARFAGDYLVQSAVEPVPGRAAWTLIPEVGGGQPLGYAHGAAGIADVLLDLAEVTGDEAPRRTAIATGRWLADQARPLADGAVGWPSEPGDRTWAPLWCHGATGIGRFLLHLDRVGGLAPTDRWLVMGTAVAAARLGRSLGTVLCHGLAGSIDHLLDLHQVDDSAGHLAEAWSLAGLLEAYHQEGVDGHLRCASERPEVFSPDLTVGYAGIAAVWLRLAFPERPTLLAGRAPAQNPAGR